MNTKNANIILLAIIAATFIAGAVAYPQLPEKVASHWNAAGEVNGYMNKFWGVFLLPFIMIGMFAIYFVIPLIDPLKNNIKSFRKYYDGFWILISVFMLYVFALTLLWNTGSRFNFTTAIVPAMAVLFFCMGSFLKNLKRNWFMGIRTPWTLSSDEVWDKTHQLSGKLFKAAAVISLLGLFFQGNVVIFAIIIPVIFAGVISVVYSHLLYRRLK